MLAYSCESFEASQTKTVPDSPTIQTRPLPLPQASLNETTPASAGEVATRCHRAPSQGETAASLPTAHTACELPQIALQRTAPASACVCQLAPSQCNRKPALPAIHTSLAERAQCGRNEVEQRRQFADCAREFVTAPVFPPATLVAPPFAAPPELAALKLASPPSKLERPPQLAARETLRTMVGARALALVVLLRGKASTNCRVLAMGRPEGERAQF